MGGAISSGAKVITSGFAQGMGMSNAPKYEVKEIQKTSPTNAEVSQATTTDASGIKRRRRGRSPTILTGAAGVQEGATLGTPTLLG